MEKKRKIIWIAAIAICFVAIFFAGWWMKPAKVIDRSDEMDSLTQAHRYDSAIYAIEIARYDSINSVLAVAIIGKNREIIKLRRALEVEKGQIIKLHATESVALFSAQVGDTAFLQVETDTLCVTTIPAIRTANTLFAERRHYIDLASILTEKNKLQEDMISGKQEELSVVRDRVVKLTGEYYKANELYLIQQKKLDKANKKIRNRNIAIGIIGGIAAGGIVTALIVN